MHYSCQIMHRNNASGTVNTTQLWPNSTFSNQEVKEHASFIPFLVPESYVNENVAVECLRGQGIQVIHRQKCNTIEASYSIVTLWDIVSMLHLNYK